MSLPPYPGPEGPSGDEPTDPESPGPTHQPYGEQQPPPPSSGDQPQQPPEYGQQPPPYGQQPPAYGQQPTPPYGQQPGYGQQPPAYGYGAYTGANEAGRSWSGTAIAAFVTSLVCCGLPSVILGIIGLFRTGEGKGKGRWMAVTGLVLGIVGIGVQAAVVFGGVWIFNNNITPDNAEVGQCVDVDEDEDTVTMWRKDCDESHDAEVAGVHEITADEAEQYPSAREVTALCRDEVADVTADGRPVLDLINSGELEPYTVYENEDTEAGDHLACLVQGPGGDSLDEKVLD